MSLIGAALVAITIVIHAIGSTMWVRHVTQRYADDSDWRNRLSISILIQTALVLIALHAIEIMIWAVSYIVLLPDGELASFEKAVYFSFVTFTTLGYGDITLSEGWRILSGIEALNGILLVGWTTALLFAVVQRMWRGLATK
jgi:voltage-gated potassium channel